MRIVVIGTRGIPNIQGGVETHCQELYPRLVNLGCEVILIRRSCYILPENRLDKYKGVKLIDVYAPKKKSFEAIIHSFLSVIKAKELKADVLHIHAIGPSLVVPFARMLGIKVVMTHHGPDYDRQKWGKLAKWSLKLGERLGVKYANEVIVISNVINDLIKQKYKRLNARLIFNGVPSPQKIETTAYLSSLGIRPQKYILAVGRFVPEKGFDLLIKAFASLQIREFQLVIVGDADHSTSYSQSLKLLAEQHKITFTGFLSGTKLQEIFTHAYLFVLPSFHEGLPISLLEAMSYQINVLVSNIPANVEVGLDKDCYFEVGNETELRDKIEDRLRKHDSPPPYNMTSYNWDVISTQVLNTYENL